MLFAIILYEILIESCITGVKALKNNFYFGLCRRIRSYPLLRYCLTKKKTKGAKISCGCPFKIRILKKVFGYCKILHFCEKYCFCCH
jgi:hypothetical protein